MNRADIREAVRDILGDYTQGFWNDDELNRIIQLMCNRHAQEALSVPITENTTSLPGVQEYVLPPYFGEMRRVRWYTDTGEVWTLSNAPKTDILNRSGSEFLSIDGNPTVYYRDGRIIGLYPIPNKKPVFSHEPTEPCNAWQTIDTARDANNDWPTDYYAEQIYLKLENICSVKCSHVSLQMRRNSQPVRSAIRLVIQPVGAESYKTWFSRWINTRDLPIEEAWIHFDFTHFPVELTDTVDTYNFTFEGDRDFIITSRRMYGSEGPQFGVNVSEAGERNMYFQLHPYRQDIELDFYKNEVEAIDTDHKELELPSIYARTVIKMTAGRALRKGQRDLQGALYWEAEAEKEITRARAQAVLQTRGRMLRTEGVGRYYGPDATYADGVWRIRGW